MHTNTNGVKYSKIIGGKNVNCVNVCNSMLKKWPQLTTLPAETVNYATSERELKLPNVVKGRV